MSLWSHPGHQVLMRMRAQSHMCTGRWVPVACWCWVQAEQDVTHTELTLRSSQSRKSEDHKVTKSWLSVTKSCLFPCERKYKWTLRMAASLKQNKRWKWCKTPSYILFFGTFTLGNITKSSIHDPYANTVVYTYTLPSHHGCCHCCVMSDSCSLGFCCNPLHTEWISRLS